jgi:thioredoxin 1
MSSNVQEVTDATFDTDVLQNEKPVVVDFWAAWCGPCRMVAPEIEKLADKYAGQVEVRKLDVDANPQTAMKYGIMSIPTVAMFKQGEAPRAAVGFRPLEALEQAFGLEAIASSQG